MDDLITLRLLAAAASGAERAMLREAAGLASLPLDFVEAESPRRAVELLNGGGIDLVLLDSAWNEDDQQRVADAARGAPKPAFVIVLAGGGKPADAKRADAIAVKPSSVEEARKLIDGCARSRLPCRALVVDDSSTMRSIVCKILSAARFPIEVSQAADGSSAIEQTRKTGVDIVFLDYNMPGLDGLATLTEIKRARPHIIVVIMTSAPEAEVASRALEAGAASFLKKPFYPADIDAVLHGCYGLVPVQAA
jgi:CheY-like chemotaxis protein